MIVGNVHQRSYPQLNGAEYARETPHVLVFQITSVAPTIDFNGKFVLSFAHILCHVKLGRRHRVLAITHLLAVNPKIHSRMNTTKMQNKIVFQHLFGDIYERHIRTYWVAVFVGRPVFWRFAGHAGAVPHERVVDVNINRCSVSLCLPVAGYGDFVPFAHIVVLLIEVGWPLFWLSRPMEKPLSVERDDFLTFLLSRGQLQRGVIGEFVDS